MRLMRRPPSPDRADDLAADTPAAGLMPGDDALRGRHDRDAHPAQNAGDGRAVGVDAPAGLGHTLQAADDAPAVAAVLEAHDQLRAHGGLAQRLGGGVAPRLESPRGRAG